MSPKTLEAMSEKDRTSCVVVYLQIDPHIRAKRLLQRLGVDGEEDGGLSSSSRKKAEVLVAKRLDTDAALFPHEFNNFDVRITNPHFNPMKTVNQLLTLIRLPQPHETRKPDEEKEEVSTRFCRFTSK